MSICPNKSSKEWYDLKNGLKEKFKQQGSDYTDEQIEEIAEMAFHRYGDTPPVDKAIDYLLGKISREEAQYNKWVNYARGQFINGQGELSFDDFKESFSNRFGIDQTDENLRKIYEDGKNKYEAGKISQNLFTNVVGEKQQQEGNKQKERVGLIPWAKDYFVSNFNQLGKISQDVKDAVAKYFSSASQAASLLKGAVSEISRKYGNETWSNLRKVLVQSRLDGIRHRWEDMSRTVLTMSDEDLVNGFKAEGSGNYAVLLNEIEQRNPLSNLQTDAATLLESGDFEQLRALLSGAFKNASENVAKIDFSGGPSYEEIKNDQKTQEALSMYKELIEAPLTENHASNEGVFSNALGELDTYYPLIPLDEKGNKLFTKRGPKLNSRRNQANTFATGLSNAYDIAVDKLSERVTAAFKANNKNVLIKSMQDAGLLKIGTAEELTNKKITINGVDYNATVVQITEDRIINGKRVPGKKALIPNWLAKELEPMLNERVMNKTVFGKVMDKITAFSLGGPIEASIHSTNLVGALVNGTPWAGTSLLSKTIGNTPVTKIFTGIFNIISEDVTSENAIKHIQEMAAIGLLPEKSGSLTGSQEISEATGAKKVWKIDPSRILYGRKGIDIKARVLMDRICLEINPDATPEQRRQFSYQLGNYVKGLEGQLERTVKRNGMAPFFTASSTFLKNGIKGSLGMAPLPTEGQTLPRRMTMRAAHMFSGGVVGLVGTWVAASYALYGKFPWDDKESRFLKLRVTPEGKKTIDSNPLLKSMFYKNGQLQDFNMGFLNPIIERGERAIGAEAAYNSYIQGATLGQASEAVKKDQLNSFLTPLVSSPGIKFLTTATLGVSPHISSLRDNLTGKPELGLMRSVKTMKNGLEQSGANIAQGLEDINPVVGRMFEHFGFDFKPKYSAEDENSFKIFGDIQQMMFPNMFKPHIDNLKIANNLRKQENKMRRSSMRETKRGARK
jgi:hypothetical protein